MWECEIYRKNCVNHSGQHLKHLKWSPWGAYYCETGVFSTPHEFSTLESVVMCSLHHHKLVDVYKLKTNRVHKIIEFFFCFFTFQCEFFAFSLPPKSLLAWNERVLKCLCLISFSMKINFWRLVHVRSNFLIFNPRSVIFTFLLEKNEYSTMQRFHSLAAKSHKRLTFSVCIAKYFNVRKQFHRASVSFEWMDENENTRRRKLKSEKWLFSFEFRPIIQWILNFIVLCSLLDSERSHSEKHTKSIEEKL